MTCPGCAEREALERELRKVAAFEFSTIERREGYRAALRALVELKRSVRAVLRGIAPAVLHKAPCDEAQP